jgi:UDP-hydrolysing UDP-N-acetyl-D-glucosamine 2-epimerase
MIGDGWDDAASVRPGEFEEAAEARVLRVCCVTGSRAEFGLLRPVMLAISRRPELELAVVAAGSHLILPAQTFRDVKQSFAIADIVPMQVAGKTGQAEDVQSLARGVARFGRAFETLRPDWVLVLGDRIEALAAGLAASIGGVGLLHVHGGDRAEGISDEAIRHSLSKLAHVHFAATPASAQRLVQMGEDSWRVHQVGSPAIDELAECPELSDEAFAELGSPELLMLMHPVGRSAEQEEAGATAILAALRQSSLRLLLLEPNLDPGRDGIVRALSQSGLPSRAHLPRAQFVGLLRRIAREKGCLVGNSSAGLIECAALGVPVVDIGPRQAGREVGPNVVHVAREDVSAITSAIVRARALNLAGLPHPYGDGHTGERIASHIAQLGVPTPRTLRKRCAY